MEGSATVPAQAESADDQSQARTLVGQREQTPGNFTLG